MKKVSRLLAVVAVLASALLVETARADEASAIDAPMTHWNIFGGCATVAGYTGNCGGTRPTATLQFLVAPVSNKPWSITLNEVCGAQVWDAIARFQQYGYSFHYNKTNGQPDGTPRYSPINCGEPNNAGVHGNLIMYLGQVTDGGDIDFTTQSGSGDWRSMGWVQASTFVGPLRTIVSHLDYSASNNHGSHTPGSLNGQQNSQLKGVMDFMSLTGQPVVAGADRNTTRHEPFQGYAEIDPISPKLGTYVNVFPADKLDWVIGNYRYGTSPSATQYCPPADFFNRPISDHCLLNGKFLL